MGNTRMTAKQQLFVEAYAGNATEAAIQAGYSAKTAHSIGEENLRNPEIQKAIQSGQAQRSGVLIASREARQTFWTATMGDAEQPMRDRLKASELLGRSEGDFLERVEHSGAVTTEVQVYRIPDNGRD